MFTVGGATFGINAGIAGVLTFSQDMGRVTKLKEHPTFHRNSMIVGFLLVVLVFVFGGVSIYAENEAGESPIPGWLIIANIGALIGWMLYRALLARPRCPFCKCCDTERIGDYNGQIQGSTISQNWRRYRCASCDDDFVVPGFNLES